MKRALVLVVIVLALPSHTLGQFGNKKNRRDGNAEQQLRNLVRIWDEAYVKGDAATLNSILADEFSFVGGPNKPEYLASVKSSSPDSHVESAVSDEVTVQIYGNTAIVTGLDTISVIVRGQRQVNKWLYMDVWVKRAGRWQCVKTYSSLSTRK
jgi:ketosteroid isomerase-like protein